MATTHTAHSVAATWPAALAHTVVQTTTNIVFALDRSGTVRYANPAALTLLGTADVIGRRFLDLLDDGSRAKGQRLIDSGTASEQAFEINQLTADAQITLVRYRAHALGDEQNNGVAHGVLLIGTALSETVATTERLVALNRRLNALLTVSSTTARSLLLNDVLQHALAVAITELDLQAGAVLLIDGATEQGTSAADHSRLVIQQGFAPAFAERVLEIDQIRTLWHAQTPAQQPVVISGSADDIGIHPSDLEHTVGPLLTSAASPIISDERLIGWLYVLTDRYRGLGADDLDLLRTIGNVLGPPIANARLYGELVEASGRLRAVLDSIDSGVMLVDQIGVVRFVNPRLGALLQTDVSQWPGRSRQAVMPPTLVLSTQPTQLFADEIWEFTGAPRRMLRRFAEDVHDLNHAPIGTIEVYSDVTQIQEMARLKDEFVAAAAHDLKTPVTAVKGYAQIALRLARRNNDERLAQQLAMINARSDELTHLMDALLDMSRIQAGRMYLDLDRFPLYDLITKVVNHFDFDLRRRQRQIDLRVFDPSLEVTWDFVRMEGVLINLVGNAIKYSPDGGALTIDVRPFVQADYASDGSDDMLELIVTDYGIGIPPAERNLIFDRFYRVHSAIEQGFKGTGIGLYISQYIVTLHGGRVWAADALHGGAGTSMHVVLPRVCVQTTYEQ